MAYCAEREREFHVSTMFEYYKALISQNYLLQHFLVTHEYRNRWHTKLHPNTNSGCGRFSYYRIIYHYDDSAHYFGNLKALEAIQASILIVSKQPLVLLGAVVG
jgi:hypothetical protein